MEPMKCRARSPEGAECEIRLQGWPEPLDTGTGHASEGLWQEPPGSAEALLNIHP